jgi:hypothetical protein
MRRAASATSISRPTIAGDLPPSHGGRAREQEVVEGQGDELARQVRAAVDDREHLRREALGHEAREQLAGGGRRLGHLHQAAVAGGERRDQRAGGEVDRIVPGHHDADDAERLGHHARGPGLEPEAGGGTPRAHPAREVAARVADRFERGEDFEQLGLGAGAPAEVAIDRRGEGIGVVAQQRFEPAERLQALAAVEPAVQVAGAPLAVECFVEGCVGDARGAQAGPRFDFNYVR